MVLEILVWLLVLGVDVSLLAESKGVFKNRTNLRWVSTQFATAMGIGILFVPQELGPREIGIQSFLIMLVLCIPLSYLNHKTLSSLIIFGGNGGGSVLTIKKMEGIKTSLFYSLLLFVSSFSICIINFLAIVSTITQSVEPSNSEISRISASIFIGIAIYFFSSQGRSRIILMTKYISFPLAVILIFISLMLIPYWDWDILSESKTVNPTDIISLIPIVIFAMNFSPCVSGYIESSMIECKNDKHTCNSSVSSTLLSSCIAIAFVVMFFSFSVSMSLNDTLLDNMGKNTNSITLITQLLGGGWYTIVGFLIVTTASFGALMGTLIGVNDGLKDLVFMRHVKEKNMILLIVISLVTIGIINPNIIDLIKIVSGPSVIIVGMLFPALIMIKNRKMQWVHPPAIILSIITLTIIF